MIRFNRLLVAMAISGCLGLRCPEPSCSTIVYQDMGFWVAHLGGKGKIFWLRCSILCTKKEWYFKVMSHSRLQTCKRSSSGRESNGIHDVLCACYHKLWHCESIDVEERVRWEVTWRVFTEYYASWFFKSIWKCLHTVSIMSWLLDPKFWEIFFNERVCCTAKLAFYFLAFFQKIQYVGPSVLQWVVKKSSNCMCSSFSQPRGFGPCLFLFTAVI